MALSPLPRVWVATFVQLALLGIAGVLVGWLYDAPLIGFLVAVLLALGWQLLWLYRLERWLRKKSVEYMPEGSGVWPRVFARIDFFRRRARRRGKRFKALVKQLRHATRTFPDGGVILNEQFEIVVYNEAAEQLLGLKKKDRGLRIESLLRDPDFVAYKNSGDYSRTVQVRAPVNVDCWLSCHLVPYGLEQKMLLVRDVTQQHRADAMRRDFVANASHELRTPLTVISGYLDALAEDTSLSRDLVGPVTEMQRQSLRMRLLVDDLLRLSELESDRDPIAGTAVGIASILETARQETLASGRGPENIEIVLDSDDDLLGVEKEIQSVVSNLVSNAARYTPRDGLIRVRWWTDKKGGYISVTDTGSGIAREHIPRLTERFYRVENGRARIGGEGGTGLGLAIVKHALLRHAASLNIQSELGKGSTFSCLFPRERVISTVT